MLEPKHTQYKPTKTNKNQQNHTISRYVNVIAQLKSDFHKDGKNPDFHCNDVMWHQKLMTIDQKSSDFSGLFIEFFFN